MSIFLVGGGPDTTTDEAVYESFLEEARGCAGLKDRTPRVAVVLFDHEGSGPHFLPVYGEPLHGCEVLPVYARHQERVAPTVFADVDGIVVGGGPTPEYHTALSDVAKAIRSAVREGTPYLGFSAGAMIAAEKAVIGGYRLDGVAVCPAEWSEGLDEVTLQSGLGLVPFTVDVHCAQAGTLSRAVAAVESGEAVLVYAIDENTALVTDATGNSDPLVLGDGRLWCVRAAGSGGASVRSIG
ncbi:hypothetical protein GCM10027403_07380 [Arthrobacter tecti]